MRSDETRFFSVVEERRGEGLERGWGIEELVRDTD